MEAKEKMMRYISVTIHISVPVGQDQDYPDSYQQVSFNVIGADGCGISDQTRMDQVFRKAEEYAKEKIVSDIQNTKRRIKEEKEWLKGRLKLKEGRGLLVEAVPGTKYWESLASDDNGDPEGP